MLKTPTSRSTRRAPSRGKILATNSPKPAVKMTGQEWCQFCTELFKKGDLITQYSAWKVEASERLGHPYCLALVSRAERAKSSRTVT
jgi:hypothetical protein